MKNTELISFIEELRQSWKPKTQTGSSYGYHGSNKGDYMEYTEYFNVYTAKWTTNKDEAFKGYIFDKISDILFEDYLNKRHESTK